MITDNPKTWLTCVFCGLPVPPYFISRKATYAVSGTGLANNSLYAHEDCILSRHAKPLEGRTVAPEAEQASMALEAIA